MDLLTPFDVALRTAYAETKELAFAQRQVPLTTPGSLQLEQRGERSFVYHYRYLPSGSRVSEYLGPEDEEATAERVAEVAAEIDDAKALAGRSRDLRRIGFYSADNSTVVTVAALFNAGIFAGGGILVGTHAYGILLNDLGVRGGMVPRTEDVDVARASPIEIAALPKGGLLALLRGTGLPFHDVPQLRRDAPATSFKVRGRPLRVDLLVPAKGKPYQPVAVPELGAHATGLPHLRYLLDEATPSVLLGRDRVVPVAVPHAGRFCLHKLAVYSVRSDGAKREKDLAQAATIIAALAEGDDFLLSDGIAAMDRALRAKVRAGARKVEARLAANHPTAARAVAPLA